MKYVILKKDMDDAVAARKEFEAHGNKQLCGNCKFFDGDFNDYWAICHNPPFNRSVQITSPTGRKTLEDVGGSFVRSGFSCPFWKTRGRTVEGGGNPPWGYSGHVGRG